MSCLHEAASLGDADLLEDGLVKGADPNERDWDWGGRTALHIAAANGDKDCVLLLIQYNADVNSRKEDGWTPLHNACEGGHLSCVQALLAADANYNSRDKYGDTPARIAQIYGHFDCEKLIINKQCQQECQQE